MRKQGAVTEKCAELEQVQNHFGFCSWLAAVNRRCGGHGDIICLQQM